MAYLHRSRFMLGFPVNGELFYYEAEHRRLLWLQTQIEKQTSSGMFSARGTSRMLKELKRERVRMYKRLRLVRSDLLDRIQASFSAFCRVRSISGWTIGHTMFDACMFKYFGGKEYGFWSMFPT